MQSLCDIGFYNDMAWEVGTSCSGKRKIIFKDFLGKSDVKAMKINMAYFFNDKTHSNYSCFKTY